MISKKRLREDNIQTEEEPSGAFDDDCDFDLPGFLEFFKHWKYRVVYCFRGWEASGDIEHTTMEQLDTQDNNPFFFRKDFLGRNLGITTCGCDHGFVSDFIGASTDNPVYVARRYERDDFLFVWYNASTFHGSEERKTPLSNLSKVFFNDDQSQSGHHEDLEFGVYDFFAGDERRRRPDGKDTLACLELPSVRFQELALKGSCCEAHYLLQHAMCVRNEAREYRLPLGAPYSATLTWFRVVSGYCEEDVTQLRGGGEISAALPSKYSYFRRFFSDTRMDLASLPRLLKDLTLDSQHLKRVLPLLWEKDWADVCQKRFMTKTYSWTRVGEQYFWEFFRRVLRALPYSHRFDVVQHALDPDNLNHFLLQFRLGFFRLYLRYMQCRRRALHAALKHVPRAISFRVLCFSEAMPSRYDFIDLKETAKFTPECDTGILEVLEMATALFGDLDDGSNPYGPLMFKI